MISEERLRGAMEAQAFVLHYLPMVELETSRTIATEALLRLPDGQQGLLAPIDFLPVAEGSGAIVELGYWVLQEACRQIQHWQRRELPALNLGINLSPAQCLEPGFAQKYLEQIGAAGISPERLTLEVSQENLATHISRPSPLKELRAAGVHIAMDNFGRGYVDMQDIPAMEVDAVKIDRSMIKDLEQNPDIQTLLFELFKLSRLHNIQVIAEGVETAEQLDRLEGYGCQYMQGFLFDGPQPPEQIEALFRV